MPSPPPYSLEAPDAGRAVAFPQPAAVPSVTGTPGGGSSWGPRPAQPHSPAVYPSADPDAPDGFFPAIPAAAYGHPASPAGPLVASASQPAGPLLPAQAGRPPTFHFPSHPGSAPAPDSADPRDGLPLSAPLYLGAGGAPGGAASDMPPAPAYDAVVLVPQGSAFRWGAPPAVLEPSQAAFRPTSKGVESHDPLLSHSSDELWKFLLTHASPPRVWVRCHGWEWETQNNSDGGSSQRKRTLFSFRFDLTPYFMPHWAEWAVGIQGNAPFPGLMGNAFNIPAATSAPPASIREVLELFTRSKRSFKDFVAEKVVCGWDFSRFEGQVRSIIHAAGYGGPSGFFGTTSKHLDVDFPIEGWKIEAYGPSRLNSCATNSCCRALCCISCLWIFAWPWYAWRRQHTKQLFVAYHAAKSETDWLANNGAALSNLMRDYMERHRLTFANLFSFRSEPLRFADFASY